MPADQKHKGEADGVNSQAKTNATGGSDAGAPYPGSEKVDAHAHFADGPLSHGGQSKMGYHGTGRLGRQKTRPEGNPNAATGEDD
ncbi:MAG: hypothetical protein ABGW87_14280 [Sphingomonadaceae bacterium]